jgi:hypothetical protein
VAELRQSITVSIGAQELAGIALQQWETKRKEITKEGALGVANHTGCITLDVNGTPAVLLWLHEDELGYVVIDVFDAQNRQHLGRQQTELGGLVPPRTESKQKRERRFGDDFPG